MNIFIAFWEDNHILYTRMGWRQVVRLGLIRIHFNFLIAVIHLDFTTITTLVIWLLLLFFNIIYRLHRFELWPISLVRRIVLMEWVPVLANFFIECFLIITTYLTRFQLTRILISIMKPISRLQTLSCKYLRLNMVPLACEVFNHFISRTWHVRSSLVSNALEEEH